MAPNFNNYADLDKDFFLEFLKIDYGHLWWVICEIVWRRRYKIWLSAFDDYKKLDYKGLRLFLLGLSLIILCIFGTIYVILNYLFIIKNRRNCYLSYDEYQRLKYKVM